MTTTKSSDANPDLDPDALFAALEAEEDLDDPSMNPSYRAARLQKLSNDLAHSKNAQRGETVNSSNYRTLDSDPQVLSLTTENPRTIIHFFHPDFSRCSTMDSHLEALSAAHSETGGGTLFARVNVKNADFVVNKLAIRVLPCVVGFVNGVAKERITGFEVVGGFGGDEKSKTVTRGIEKVFVNAEVLQKKRLHNDDAEDSDEEILDIGHCNGTLRRGIKGMKFDVGNSDDDWD